MATDNTEARLPGLTPDIVIPLHDEEVLITKRNVVRGSVRVGVTTQLREHLVDELLRSEHVEVERVTIGRTIETMPEIREEGNTTIIPIVEEVIITERRLVLKEEVRLHRVQTAERHTETVILRSQDAEISRLLPAASGQLTQEVE